VETSGKETILKRLLLGDFGIILIFLALAIVMSILTPVFYTPVNLLNILRQVSVIGIISFGVTLIIIAGGIDLSPGSVAAFVGVVVAGFVSNGHSLLVSLLVALAVGALCGLTNGSLVAFTGIPPFIATLGMMSIARALALIYSKGRPITLTSEAASFLAIGSGKLLGIPIPVLIFISTGVLSHIILKKTRFGKYVFAVGGNEQAAVVCGINVRKIKIYVFTFGGIMTALASIVLTSRVSSGNPTAALSYELDAIAATVIGGTSLSGGIGSIFGAFIGALIIGSLNNGLSLLGISPYWQQIAKGVAIIAAVISDVYRSKSYR
jgi:inositol transport system permease protein